MSNYRLTIDNKDIFLFYEKYSLDFEQINILFYNILQQIMISNDNSLNNNIASTILNKISSIEQSISTHQINTQNHVTEKFNEYRKEYINDIKLLMLSNNAEHISPLIKETNNNLIDKTTLMLNDIIPKNNEPVLRELQNNFNHLQTFLSNETNKFLSSTQNEKSMDDFLTNSNQFMTQSLNNLTSIINSSDSRLENKLHDSDAKINEMTKLFSENNASNLLLQNSINDILKKFEKGVGKGNISENIVYNILLNLFPCAQIDHVGETKETGDIMLIRKDKPKILIENKDHTSCNVPRTDVEKFIRDCEIQQCSGIMFAQNKGISNKDNYEVQIHNGNVLLYVHNVNFEPDKIKTSIEIVEQFKIKLDELNVGENVYNIDTNTLNEINKEYNSYIQQKNNLLKMVRDFNEKMNSSINDLKMPNLEQYLSKHYASSTKQGENICKYCEKFIPKSMSQHYRYCSAKKNIDKKNLGKTEQNEIVIDNLEIQK